MAKVPWNIKVVEKICEYCWKPFRVSPSHADKRHTCSTKCAGKLKTQKFLNAVANRTEKACYRCKRILPLSEFRNHKQKPDGKFPYCKECHDKSSRQYDVTHREHVRKRSRDYMRRVRIGQNGKDIRNVKNKRPYPDDIACEVCKTKDIRLVYHHWNNNDFSKGLWICTKCHVAAHWLDSHCPTTYYSMKSKINQSTS